MLIERTILNSIYNSLHPGRVTLLYGPRQSGKTTLIKNILAKTSHSYLSLNGDEIHTQELLGKQDVNHLKSIVGGHKLLIIDEAQRIPNIGLSLKLICDNIDIAVLASGSASFDLANKVNEPLTGRGQTFFLYPLSWEELPKDKLVPEENYFEQTMRFGLYPKVATFSTENEKQEYLSELINTYLYKDILTFELVRKPKKIIDLLTLLALQIGSEVSIAELSSTLNISKVIVEKYLDLMEKMFIVVNLRGLSRNLRKEVTKTSKYYFLDLGIRNALIRNFNHLKVRQDQGSLWENFCIIERFKTISNTRQFANFYFWRTYDQKEIDLIEEREGRLHAFEFKLSEKPIKRAVQKEFIKAYPNTQFNLITKNNFEDLQKL